MPDVSMPLAVPDEGMDPTAFYATFAGKLAATWAVGDPLEVSVDADIAIARLHAPVKAAMRFAPAGTVIDESPLSSDTLLLTTWPLAYADLRESMGMSVTAA